MSSVTGPNLVTSGLVFNIDSFRYTNFNLGAKTWTTIGLESSTAGTISGTPTWSTSTGAMSFPNSGDFVSWPSSSLYAFGTNDFTIEVWIYPTSFSGYLHMVALPDQNTFGLKANTGDGQIYFYSTAFTTFGSTAGWTLALNQWNHVVFKRTSSIAYAYLNGALIGSKTGFTNNFTPQVLNVHNGWPGEFVPCQMNAVRIYNRGLSDTEVSQNYLAFRNRVYEPVSFPALTTTLAIASRSIVVNTTDTGFTPVTASGGYNGVVWSSSPVLPTGLTINPVNGLIFGTPVGLLSTTSYTLTAIDAIGQTSSKAFSLTVTPVPLTTTLDLPTVLNFPNIPLSVRPVSATGGFGTLSYSISPALPSGLNFNTVSGFITGSYNTTINQSYTVTVIDQATPTPQTSNKVFTLSITAPPALSTTLAQASYNFSSGQQLTPFQPVTASGGVPSYTYTVSPLLVSGLSLNSSTGVISGAPATGLATTSYTVTATDAALQTSAKTFTITVAFIPADPQSITTSAPYSFTGTTQSFTVPAGIFWIRVTANGGGGSGGGGAGANSGGAGGQLVGWVATTPGTVYNVIVGAGGAARPSSTTDRYGGGGGGFSGILSGTTHIATAGGGGGGQISTPVVSSGIATTSGGHTTVYSTTAATGGAGGAANSPASADPILNGAAGTSAGGGNGGATWNGSLSLDAGGGGGGGGFGTNFGTGGNGAAGTGANDGTGTGSSGGFGGGGGGGGGGTGGAVQRTGPGGGGGGGHIGGAGGVNTTTNPTCAGQGGWNYLIAQTNPRGGTPNLMVITATSGGGSAGGAGNTSGPSGAGVAGSVTIQY